MGRTFTVKDSDGPGRETHTTVYQGFDCSLEPASELDLIAVVLVEGEPDLYALEDTAKARAELVRYLSDRGEVGTKIAGIYRRTK